MKMKCIDWLPSTVKLKFKKQKPNQMKVKDLKTWNGKVNNYLQMSMWIFVVLMFALNEGH